MKIVLLSSLLFCNTLVLSQIGIDSFIREPLKYIDSKYLFIGELHNIQKNNSFYFPFMDANFIGSKVFSGSIREFSQIDAMWFKIQISTGDTSEMNKVYRYNSVNEFNRYLSKIYYKKPVDSIPFWGIDAIEDWWYSLKTLSDFSKLCLPFDSSFKLPGLISKIDSAIHPDRITAKKVRNIVSYILSDSYFLKFKDIYLAAYSMKFTMDQQGLKKAKTYQRDNIMLKNLLLFDSLYAGNGRYFGIFGRVHLGNKVIHVNFNKKIHSMRYLYTLNYCGTNKLNIRTIVIYYPFEYSHFCKSKKNYEKWRDDGTCSIDDQVEAYQINNLTRAELIELNSCYDYALINIHFLK